MASRIVFLKQRSACNLSLVTVSGFLLPPRDPWMSHCILQGLMLLPFPEGLSQMQGVQMLHSDLGSPTSEICYLEQVTQPLVFLSFYALGVAPAHVHTPHPY
jgi:hypothetical protein